MSTSLSTLPMDAVAALSVATTACTSAMDSRHAAAAASEAAGVLSSPDPATGGEASLLEDLAGRGCRSARASSAVVSTSSSPRVRVLSGTRTSCSTGVARWGGETRRAANAQARRGGGEAPHPLPLPRTVVHE